MNRLAEKEKQVRDLRAYVHDALRLRDKAHAYCAAADYADAEAHQEEADAVPEAYLGAVAGTVRRCAKLLEALEDELHKPSAGQATDDAGRSETEASDGDDVAPDDTPPRHLPEGVVYLRAAFDDVIEALSAAYGARERDWLENALERVVRRLGASVDRPAAPPESPANDA